jgi:hypothetical protein
MEGGSSSRVGKPGVKRNAALVPLTDAGNIDFLAKSAGQGERAANRQNQILTKMSQI